MKTIYFDMDGTIADLYGVENWLPLLRAENTEPYAKAQPLVNAENFTQLINALQNKGLHFGIISWGSKGGSNEYTRAVAKVKRQWLKDNFNVEFNEIHIIKYGTPKHYVAKDKTACIFDDDKKVRDTWNGQAINPEIIKIENFLEKLLKALDK